MAEHPRYRVTRASFDVVSVYGCLGATAVPGPVFGAVLGDRGYGPSAVRNQLTRLVHRGVILRSVHGRTSLYRLGPVTRAQFVRLRNHENEVEFSGSFRCVVHRIPESERGLRDRVVYLATHQGYRQLRPGVLIAFHDGHEQFRRALTDLGGARLADRIDLCRLVPSDIDQARRWVAAAWETTRLRETVTAEEAGVRSLVADGGASESTFFDRFYAVAMTCMRTPRLPEELAPGLRAQQRLWELQARLESLYRERYAARVLDRVRAVPAADLIAFDPGT